MSDEIEQPTAILVSPDFGCCLWWLEPEQEQPEGLGPGGISPEDLRLPAELSRGFRDWMDRYFALYQNAAVEDPAFSDDGRALAQALKRYYGASVRVMYGREEMKSDVG